MDIKVGIVLPNTFTEVLEEVMRNWIKEEWDQDLVVVPMTFEPGDDTASAAKRHDVSAILVPDMGWNPSKALEKCGIIAIAHLNGNFVVVDAKSWSASLWSPKNSDQEEQVASAT